MNQQSMYSLAIQALHERLDRLERNLSQAYNTIDISMYPNAIRECNEAIRYFENQKNLSLVLGGNTDCPFTIHIVDKDCKDWGKENKE